MMSSYQEANSALLFENGSSLGSEHLNSEELASSEGFHELHEADVSLKSEEPRPRQSEAAVGEHESATVKDKVAKLLKGKEREWEAVVKKDRPLQLLDLPVDVLKEIIKEVSMASKDATSLIILKICNRLLIPTTSLLWRSLTPPYTILLYLTSIRGSILSGPRPTIRPNLGRA